MAVILYVDDEEAVRRAVAAWLTRRGHVVHAAASIAAAVDLLESKRVDGAFVDLWIGGESGLQLRELIDEHRPDLSDHVVLVTGDPHSSPTGRPVLAKPFDLAALDAFVERWTGG